MENNQAEVADEGPEPLGENEFQARAALDDALNRLAALSEIEVASVLSDGPLERLFGIIAPQYSTDKREGELLYDYLLRRKVGLTLIAQIRLGIMYNYSLAGSVEGRRVYVSPDSHQWFDDGVMFLQGEERFAGLLGLYRDGKVSFAVSARDTVKGEALGPNDFVYIDVDDYHQRALAYRRQPNELEAAPAELRALLAGNVAEEARYQEYLERYPWVLGAQYSSVQSHERLDDRNIPDFSGVRLRDSARDILEIKSPMLALFRGDGEFSADFSNAWHQTERYLDFARIESEYLFRQRGLRFENPHCFLIAGKGLTPDQLKRIRSKERMNPAITFLTYDDLLTLVDGTVALIGRLQTEARAHEA